MRQRKSAWFGGLASLSLIAGISLMTSFAVAPLTAAQAAYPSWGGYAGQSKRPLFRPLSGPQRSTGVSRSQWRPQVSGGLARSLGSRSQGLPERPRAIAPVKETSAQRASSMSSQRPHRVSGFARGSAIGARFRPDPRFAGIRRAAAGNAVPVKEAQHIGFRPTSPSRRVSYEELQAAGQPGRYRHANPFGGRIAATSGAYPAYWRAW